MPRIERANRITARLKQALTLAMCLSAFVMLTDGTPAQRLGAPASGTRIVANEAALGGIDRGYRPLDPVVSAWSDPLGAIAPAPGRPSYLPGAVIVKFEPAAGEQDVRRVAESIGAHAVEQPDYADFSILTIDPQLDAEEVARRLTARPEVAYAEARYPVIPMYVPNDPLYAQQWNFRELDMERVWDINPGASASVIAAVIDSGVAFRQVVLRYNIQARTLLTAAGPIRIPNQGPVDVPFAAAPDLGGADRFVAPRDFAWNDVNPVDVFGHGTHIAGTIGQLTGNATGVAGMAFNVRIMPIKVVLTAWDLILGLQVPTAQDTMARAIRYAVDNGARVINLSIGIQGEEANQLIEDAMRHAVSRGVFIAIAAGNDGAGENRPNPTATIAPRIDGVMAVGAVGPGLQRAFYSTASPIVEIAAPGGDTLMGRNPQGGVLQQTLDPDVLRLVIGPDGVRIPRFDSFAYRQSSGTSMATPHVAALAAILMSQGLTDPAAIEAAIKRFAIDKGPPGPDDEYGYGVINPRATLRGLGLIK